ncbi:hypothetical protein [Clostridium kluyveri]|nr:hypothetical protein [Clostridium kluyveri]
MIFFTVKIEEYCAIKYKLMSNGIKIKTKIIRHKGVRNPIAINGSRNEYYEIYIQPKEIEKANKIIYS